MPTWVIYLLIATGGVTLGTVGLWLLYRAGRAAGAASEQATAATDAIRIERKRSEVLQKEVTRDDTIKSLEDGSF